MISGHRLAQPPSTAYSSSQACHKSCPWAQDIPVPGLTPEQVDQLQDPGQRVHIRRLAAVYTYVQLPTFSICLQVPCLAYIRLCSLQKVPTNIIVMLGGGQWYASGPHPAYSRGWPYSRELLIPIVLRLPHPCADVEAKWRYSRNQNVGI